MKKYIPNLFLLSVICYLLVLISPALLGQLGGTFKSTSLPADYTKLEQFLAKDKTFYRTLWVPQIQRFAYFSNTHPAIAANDLFKLNSPHENIKYLKKESTLLLLQESSVKYIIVPYDSLGEIFLTDRKYDNKMYEATLKDIESIPYLKRQHAFGKIGVYEIPAPKDHFWSPNASLDIKYKYINPTNYQVSLKSVKKGDTLIFAESYDKGWKLQTTESRQQRAESRQQRAENKKWTEQLYTSQRWKL